MDWQASSGVQNHWEIVDVPLQGKSADNGAGWYRCVVHLPQSWKEDGTLTLGQLDQESGIRKAFLNGTPLKSTTEKVWTIPKDAVVGDDFNLLVVQSQQGLRSAPSVDSSTAGKLLLAGRWQYHRSIDQDLSQIPLPAKFGGGADIVFSLADSLYVPRPLTRPGEFTPGIEGPACDVDGNVYAVNFAEQGTIGRVSPQGAGEVFVTLPEGSTGNGIRFLDRETFYVADYTGHNILKVNLDSRKVTVHAHNSAMNQPNDIAIMDDGTLFASDPNWPESTGQLWRIDPDGTTTLLAKDLGTANGIEVSPDGQTLYVNESAQRNIWAFTITPEKSLTSKRLLKKFDDFGFDGMRCDVDGNLYVTRYGKGTVVKLSPEGKILREIPVLGSRPSNLCFGGPDGRTIYVTEVESQRLVQFRVDRPGRAFVK
ncbi:MAG: SMP-30/gluconolactonase/LRE family protein [Planctomycetaceae bacterium]|nr:SMP-30/gluconolactonase/LRE family protein [Planctomycetaceae bacterium]